MYRALLLTEHTDELTRTLCGVGIDCLPLQTTAQGGRESAPSADFVVIEGAFGANAEETALGYARLTDAVVVFVHDGNLSECERKDLMFGGVCLLDGGAEEAVKATFFRHLVIIRKHYLDLKRQNELLRGKVAEANAVGRAKCLLVERRSMSENSAHRFIEKTAMDNRLTRYAVADNIIRNYAKKENADSIGA